MILYHILCIFLCFAVNWTLSSELNKADTNELIDNQIKIIKARIQQSPDTKQNSIHNADLWRRLGLLLQTKDVRQHTGGGILQPEILEAFDKAIKLNDDRDLSMSFQMYEHRGMLLKMMGRGEEAILSHDLAIEFSGNNNEKCEAMSNKAAALTMLGRVQRAVSLYREALALCPHKQSYYLPLVQCFQELGTLNVSGWESLLIEIENSVNASYSVSNGGSSTGSSNSELMTISNLPEAANVNNLSSLLTSQGSSVFWALFEAADKVGQYSKAWKYLELAHQVEQQHRPVDPNIEETLNLQVNQIKSIFTPYFWPAGVGLSSKAPIFIVGMMRSGSTLLETMLDAHPSIWGLGEDSIFNGRLNEFRTNLVAAATGTPAEVKQVVNKHGNAIIQEMLNLAEHSEQSKYSSHSKSSRSRKMKQKLLPQNTIKHVVDKMLFNYRNLGFIHLVFPNALILHTIRDPMDTLFSCYKHKFDDIGLEWTLKIDTLVKQYAAYLELVQHFRTILPNRVMDIRYESLISNPEGVMKKIMNALDLPWDESVMNFHNSNRTVHTHSQSQVRHQISSKYMGVWRKYAKELQPMMQELKKHFPKLKKEGALSYFSQTNWDLDPLFDYNITVPPPRPVQSPPVATPVILNDSVQKSGKSKGKKNQPSILVQADTINIDNEQDREKFLVEMLANISMRANYLASKSTKVFTISHVRRAMREEALKEVYAKSNFKKIFGHMKNSPGRLQEYVNQLKYHNPDSRVDELVSVGYIHVSMNQYSKALKLFDALLEILYFEPKDADLEYIDELKNVGGGHQPSPVLWLPRNYEITTNFSTKFTKLTSPRRHSKTKEISMCLLPEDRGSVVGILLGVSTCQALLHDGSSSEAAVTDALKIFPFDTECLKRRSEILTYMNHLQDALDDLNAIESITNTTLVNGRDIRFERSKILMMQNKFMDAYLLLMQLINSETNTAIIFQSSNTERMHVDLDGDYEARLYHCIAKCLMKLGNNTDAMPYYGKAIAILPNNKEFYLDAAFCLMELSDWKIALEYVDKVLALDPRTKLAIGYQGLLYQNLGRHQDCVESFANALAIDPNDTQCMLLSGVCYHALGDFNNSYTMFHKLLSREPKHHGFFRMESMLYSATVFNKPLTSFNPDNDLNVVIRDGVTQGDIELPSHAKSSYKSYKKKLNLKLSSSVALSQQGNKLGLPDQMISTEELTLRHRRRQLVDATARVGRWIQLNSPGFLPNKRNHVSFGLAVLQAAQTLSQHVYLRHHGKKGLYVPDAMSSKSDYFGAERCESTCLSNDPSDCEANSCLPDHHLFGWRDFYDIVVRWRQLSEPMDIVFWLDRLSPKLDVTKRLGLNTYIVRGYNNVIRYYPYFQQSLNMTKKIVSEIGYYDRNEVLNKVPAKYLRKIRNVRTLHDLFRGLYSHNFFVVVPCASRIHPFLQLNGTRITVTEATGDTISDSVSLQDFSICSASTPERFRQYEEELHGGFNKLLDAMEKSMFSTNENHEEEEKEVKNNNDDVLLAAMDLFYYWVNFAPLSRGTSATGYAGLYAAILASGHEFEKFMPEGKQLDWEALLSTHPDDFISHVRSWLTTKPLQSMDVSTVWLFDRNMNAPTNDESVYSHMLTKKDAVAGLFRTPNDILQTLVENEV